MIQFSKQTDQLQSPYPMKELFDEVEKALILHLLDNILIRKKRTGTDEVNRILGVANKSGDMQKRKKK